MNFEWIHYLELAKQLSIEGSDEASLRSAVSRSYYCVFNLASITAKKKGYRTSQDGNSHKNLWDFYGRNDEASCKQLALLGPRMKRRRVKADYQDRYEKLFDEVQEAIANAEECITIIALLEKEQPKDIPRRFSF